VTGRQADAPIIVDDSGVSRQLTDGSTESVSWDRLSEVAIRTTPNGPWNEDAFFLLVGQDGGGCAVPSRHPAADDLMERLQTLPNFDNDRFVEAMTSLEDSLFVCWQRSETGV
jgi:hypothetical protein